MKKDMKKEALKELMKKMKSGESKMQATIMADSEEGLMEGAKKLPEVLSKSEEYMKKMMEKLEKKKDK